MKIRQLALVPILIEENMSHGLDAHRRRQKISHNQLFTLELMIMPSNIGHGFDESKVCLITPHNNQLSAELMMVQEYMGHGFDENRRRRKI